MHLVPACLLDQPPAPPSPTGSDASGSGSSSSGSSSGRSSSDYGGGPSFLDPLSPTHSQPGSPPPWATGPTASTTPPSSQRGWVHVRQQAEAGAQQRSRLVTDLGLQGDPAAAGAAPVATTAAAAEDEEDSEGVVLVQQEGGAGGGGGGESEPGGFVLLDHVPQEVYGRIRLCRRMLADHFIPSYLNVSGAAGRAGRRATRLWELPVLFMRGCLLPPVTYCGNCICCPLLPPGHGERAAAAGGATRAARGGAGGTRSGGRGCRRGGGWRWRGPHGAMTQAGALRASAPSLPFLSPRCACRAMAFMLCSSID